jgi:hypothetical protein
MEWTEYTYSFDCNEKVELQRDSIWNRNYPDSAEVTSISFKAETCGDDVYVLIYVKHNLPWEIYTDSKFPKSITSVIQNKIGVRARIHFTEQGMQDDFIASLESDTKKLYEFVKKNGIEAHCKFGVK